MKENFGLDDYAQVYSIWKNGFALFYCKFSVLLWSEYLINGNIQQIKKSKTIRTTLHFGWLIN